MCSVHSPWFSFSVPFALTCTPCCTFGNRRVHGKTCFPFTADLITSFPGRRWLARRRGGAPSRRICMLAERALRGLPLEKLFFRWLNPRACYSKEKNSIKNPVFRQQNIALQICESRFSTWLCDLSPPAASSGLRAVETPPAPSRPRSHVSERAEHRQEEGEQLPPHPTA